MVYTLPLPAAASVAVRVAVKNFERIKKVQKFCDIKEIFNISKVPYYDGAALIKAVENLNFPMALCTAWRQMA